MITVITDHSTQTGVSATCQTPCWAPGLSDDNNSNNGEAVTSRHCGIVSSLCLDADATAAAIVCLETRRAQCRLRSTHALRQDALRPPRGVRRPALGISEWQGTEGNEDLLVLEQERLWRGPFNDHKGKWLIDTRVGGTDVPRKHLHGAGGGHQVALSLVT